MIINVEYEIGQSPETGTLLTPREAPESPIYEQKLVGWVFSLLFKEPYGKDDLMVKRVLVLLLIVTVVLGFSGRANAYFGEIGTASHDSNNDCTYESYNLIYEGELGGQGLFRRDYT